MKNDRRTASQEHAASQNNRNQHIGAILAWLVAFSLIGLTGYLAWRFYGAQLLLFSQGSFSEKARTGISSAGGFSLPGASGAAVELPVLIQPDGLSAIARRPMIHTVFPTRPRQDILTYQVDKGDSVFGIASRYNIKPETVLWANYDLLKDNPDQISLGMELLIPPADGVLYKWQAGDTLEAVAAQFEALPEAILNWSGNSLDLSNPQVESGALILVPGGHREFRQWLIPTIPRGRAGVSPSVYGAGACEGGYEGANGSGAFVWPAGNHVLSGNDYWSGHLGIDIAVGEGAPIYAADSGVVVFAGWATGGYGNMVMIDHGNGYQTVYAHLSSVSTGCGRSVSSGQIIGYSGSTGNSTGAHLHFEVRYQGGFVSPWFVLPAP